MIEEHNLEPFMNQGAQIPPEAVGVAIAVIVFMIIAALVVTLVAQVVICIFLGKSLNAIPEQYRLISPGMVWLLMIPCFSFIWNFFVYPKVSKSLKQFADSQGNGTVGDCGETLGWVYCGLALGSVVLSKLLPPLSGLCGIAALVLVIIYLVKTNTIAGQLRASTMPPKQPGGGSF